MQGVPGITPSPNPDLPELFVGAPNATAMSDFVHLTGMTEDGQTFVNGDADISYRICHSVPCGANSLE